MTNKGRRDTFVLVLLCALTLALACEDSSPTEPDVSPTTPAIVHFGWSTPLPTGGDPPLPLDPVSFSCMVEDLDGDPVTVTLELQDSTGQCPTPRHCWSEVESFGPGVAARANCQFCSVGVSVSRTYDAPEPPMTGILTCRVTDSWGRAAPPQTTCFRMAGAPDCPVR
ncbi:MAG: hypothetical protein ACRD1X_09845 [Vicinamibacteria bacterium]